MLFQLSWWGQLQAMRTKVSAVLLITEHGKDLPGIVQAGGQAPIVVRRAPTSRAWHCICLR